MRIKGSVFVAGAGVLLAAAVSPAWAHTVAVTLTNTGTPGETGEGIAEVDLEKGVVNVQLRDLQPVDHENAVGQRVRGYAAWLVNSEDALSKMNLGFIIPKEDGKTLLRFRSPSKKADLSGLGFNVVVITDEIELDLNRPQPSGPPIAAGHIPDTPDALTPPPAVEVLMGKVDDDVFAFYPRTIVVLNGQTVRWTNVSGKLVSPHTATRSEAIDGGTDFEFDSDAVAANGSFTHTFTLPGGTFFALFNYHCTPHVSLGMTGRIFVRVPPP